MKVYADGVLNFLIIEGVASGPLTDFEVEVDSRNQVSIKRISTDTYEVRNIPIGSFSNRSGMPFTSTQTFLDYFSVVSEPNLFTIWATEEW